MAIKDFEHISFEIAKENRSLKYQLELKDDEISNLKSELSLKRFDWKYEKYRYALLGRYNELY